MKAVVFDFDGTLVDTMDFWNNLARNYLLSIGIKPFDSLNKNLEKLTVAEAVVYMKEKYKIQKTEIQIQAEMDELIYSYYRGKVELKPFVLESLEKLKTKNIKMSIASVTDKEIIKIVLEKYGISHYFDFIQTCESVGFNKDNRKFFDLLLKRLNLESFDIYLLEDSLYPIISAKETGIKIVGVEDNFSSENKKRIIELSDVYIKDFRDFIELINRKL